jgi:hypothetical protein
MVATTTSGTFSPSTDASTSTPARFG